MKSKKPGLILEEEINLGFLLDTSMLFPTPYMLSDRGIRESIESGKIIVDDFTDQQIQPVSLNLRIGRVNVYDSIAISKAALEFNRLSLRERLGDFDPGDKYARKYPDEEGQVIDIPPRSYSEIEIHEDVQTDFLKRVDLRSSRGRLALQIELFKDRVLSIRNHNPNLIRLYGRAPFAQMFFHSNSLINGRVVSDFDEAKEIGNMLGIPTYGPYLLFQLGQHAYRFREVGLIDTKNPDENLYDKVELKDLIIPVGETIIAQLEPKIRLPADLAIQLINTPYVQCGTGEIRPNPDLLYCEPNRSNAGLVDPGYNGNVTAHLRRTKFPALYNKGRYIVLGVIIKFTKPVKRPYGSEGLNSHYQDSDGVFSRD